MKKIFYILFFVIFFSANYLPLYGDMRFKDFKSDKGRFERNIERAKKSLTEEEWQSIVDTGREVLRADWERSSEVEVERYIRQGFSEADVEEARKKASDDWEREYAREISFEKGRWYALRESIVYNGTDLGVLKESIASAKDSTSLEEWDSAVQSALEAVKNNWEVKYLPEVDVLRAKGALLSGAELEGFEEEIAFIEKELARFFDLEKGRMLYLARNKFITDLFYDQDSLRVRSEGESASVITEQVIREVMDDLKKDEDVILKRSYEAGQIEGVDFSFLGNDWQEELQRLVERGMKRWAHAREELYSAMVLWKGGAEESYESAEARWRKAALDLEKARADWEEKLSKEIYTGIENWKSQEQELNENIERAQRDFQIYVETLKNQWEDQSKGLMAMAVSGSKVYGEAVSSIKWLENMCKNYESIGAFGNLGEVKQENENFTAIISTDIWNKINTLLDALPAKQSYYDSYKIGRYSYNSSDRDWRLGTSYYKGSYYTYEYGGSVAKQDANGNWYLEEKYTVKLYGRKVIYMAMPIYNFGWGGNSSSDSRNYQWVENIHLLNEYTVINSVNFESSENEKSSYFYYRTELERWKDIKDIFGGIALDAEMTMGQNMTGDPGFLVNVNGAYKLNDQANENDPYLMTGAEYEYELARRDKEFWEKRLAIAKAVYDYAYPVNGKRESGEITEERKISAEAAMNEARENYTRALEESSAIVEELKSLQTGDVGSIEDLAKRFEAARINLAEKEDDYVSARKALIIIENGENQDYIKKEIESIERNIAETEKRIADKRLEYIKALKDFEAAERVCEFSENYKDADGKKRSAESALNEFIKNNSTGVEADQLEKYFELKLEYEQAAAVVEAMANENFKADEFIKSDNNFNFEIYTIYAGYSLEALRKIEVAFERIESDIEGNADSARTYENIKDYLDSVAEGLKFIHGIDNSDYIIIKTALKIFEEKFKGLTPEEWGAYKNRLDDDLAEAEAIYRFYTEEYHELNLTELIGEADNGSYNAAMKIREYYYPGSAIAGFEEIIRYDRRAEFDIRIYDGLKQYVLENYYYFYSTEYAGENENYLAGMIGRIIFKTGYYDEGEIELNGLDGFSIRNLSPVQMSLAVEAVYEYMNDLEKGGITVPRYIEETYISLLSSKDRLDVYLYIDDYISGRVEGSADEIYSSAKIRVETLEGVFEFLIQAGEVFESDTISSREKSTLFESMYKDLADEERTYIADSSLEEVQRMGEIISLIVEDDYVFNGKENSQILALFYEALAVIEEEHSISFQDFIRAEALQNFVSGRGDWNSWRDSILYVDGEDFRFSSAPIENETSIFDERNEDGTKDIIKYSLEKIERDGKSFSRSLIVDEANHLEGIFNALFEAAEYRPDFNGIKGVLETVAELGENYTEKELFFAIALLGLKEDSDFYSNIAEEIDSEFYSLEMMLNQFETGLLNSKNVYDSLGGSKEKKDLQGELELTRVAHEKAKKEYEDIQSQLNYAQKLYKAKNSEYIDKMNEASQLYVEFKNLEFEYEKAYSVWEYGNTPYLKGQGTDDSGFDYGTMPGTEGSSTENFAGLDVPDARDNYERIEAKYNDVLAEFTEKKRAKENQQTLEDLQGDEEYRKLKEDFLRKSEEYIRASQVDVQIREDLDRYKNEFEFYEKKYNSAKENIPFFFEKAGGLNEEEITGLVRIRDKILSHIKTEEDLKKYQEGIGNYSSWVKLNETLKRLEEVISDWSIDYFKKMEMISDLEERVEYYKIYASKFDSLPGVVKEDIKNIYSTFQVEDKSLYKIMENYHNAMFWYEMKEYAHRRTKTKRPLKKRKWKKKRDDRERKYKNYLFQYESSYANINKSLEAVLYTKNELVPRAEAYKEISQVLSLEELKAYLQQPKYGLTKEDLIYLYDESNLDGYEIKDESINIAVRRNEERRTDIDGEEVFAKILQGKIAVFDKDGKVTGTYNLDNPGVRLKFEGENIDVYEEGKIYELYDRSYNISEIAGLIKKTAEDERNKHYNALMEYVMQSALEGKNDYTVMLRDLEIIYKSLVETAVNFNRTTDEGEIRQRSFDGYSAVADEYINNIQAAVLDEMIKQNRSFQEQVWQQQREKFTERKDRWMEVTGYILNRGNRDWSVNTGEFNQLWAKWRFDARKEIEAGEEWWLEQDKAMREEMGKWNEEASKAGSKAAVERMYQDLEARVSGYEKNIKSSIPSGGNFNIDTDAILKNALSSMPEMSLGVLSNSMSVADTTAGLGKMLNLNLNGTLFIHNEKEMAAYEQAYSVMQNIRVLDILNAILDGFNEQLLYANESLYEAVETGMARSMPYFVAPFQRGKGAREWSIRVCVASNLTGDKYKTRRFTDYSNYENSTVFLKPVKGIGREIDFTKPSSYINIDKEELEVYVGLAGEFLNREIDEVFQEGGFFSKHQDNEFGRLGEKFGKYYGDWEAGEALKRAAFYSKPLFPNGPNMLQAVSIAASFTGQAWAAVLVSTLTTGVQVADGSLNWKQASFQVGMSVATSSLGAGAGKLGSMAGEAGTFANAAAKSATMQVGTTLLSGVNLEGGKLGYDTKKIAGMNTWTTAGINVAAGTITGGIKMSGISTALVNGAAGGLAGGLTTGNWQGSIVDSIRNSAASSLGGSMDGGKEVLANASSMLFGKMLGSKEDFSWDRVAKNDAIGKLVGNYLNEMLMSEEQKRELAAEEQRRQEAQSKDVQALSLMNMFENTIGGFFTNISKDLEALASDVGNAVEGVKGAANWVKDAAVSAWNGVAGAVGTFIEKTGNWFTEGHFKRNEQVEKIRAQERIEKAIRNGTSLQEGSAEYNRILAVLYGKQKSYVNSESNLIGINEDIRKLKEKEKSLAGGRKEIENIKLLKQKEINSTACYFASTIMMLEGILGHEIDLTGAYDKALNANYTDDKATVKNFEGIARTQGLDVKDGTIIEIIDRSKMVDEMIGQIDKGNPVLIQLEGKTMTGKYSSHAEIVYGYEVVDNKLRFLVKDPGGQKDTYLDSTTLTPYHGQNLYSYKNPITDRTTRSVFKIRYFNIGGIK